MKDVYVSSIHIYPVKGLAGIEVDSARAENEGLENDRKLMLVDKTGRFLSQREHAKMTLFKCDIKNSDLEISYDNDSISINLNQDLESLRPVSVWNSKLKSRVYPDKVNNWFSEHLDQEAFLVRLDPAHARYKRLFTKPYKTNVSFADGYPFLILSEASMELLNSKLDKKLLIDRFRANIILKGGEPHFEDEIEEFKIGSAEFKNINPCARCIVTTIDQQTASKTPEPLKTLAKYRKWNNNIYFGMNSICTRDGIINTDEQVLIK